MSLGYEATARIIAGGSDTVYTWKQAARQLLREADALLFEAEEANRRNLRMNQGYRDRVRLLAARVGEPVSEAAHMTRTQDIVDYIFDIQQELLIAIGGTDTDTGE